MGEVVYVLGKTVSDMVCRSHANPLLRALTGYLARKPAIPRLGGAAHAHISGLRCALAGPGARYRAQAHERAHVHLIGPACARVQEGKLPGGQASAKRARVRVASTRSEQFRMQFD